MLKIQQLIRRGSGHKDFCEDFLFSHRFDENFIISGVFDGCSSGKESHFASALFGKIFKNISVSILENTDTETIDFDKVFFDIIYQSFCKVAEVKSATGISDNELLTTVIFMLIDIAGNKAKVISFGDGLISLNGTNTIIDQDNRPDYPIYHLKELINEETFSETLSEVSQIFEIPEIGDITISTDGIESFVMQNSMDDKDEYLSPVDLLCRDTRFLQTANMLARKCNILKLKHDLVNWDDLAIIRLVNTSYYEQDKSKREDSETEK